MMMMMIMKMITILCVRKSLGWMRRKLHSANKTFDNSNLTEKIKMLKRHQALLAEIASHKPQITEVCTKVRINYN